MKILINSLRVRAFHGVLAQERTVGQEFEISAVLNVGYNGADSIGATVNYAEVCDLLAEEMRSPNELLEHCALRLCRALKSRFPAITSGELTLLKLAPPLPHQLESAGVSVSF